MRLIQITNRVCGSSKVLGGHERQEIEMARRDSGQAGGPAIRAIDPWHLGNPPRGKPRQLLSDAERAHLGALASVVRFKKGEKIYAEGAPADAIYNIISGIVTTYKTAPDGSEHVVAILYPEDLFGLSEEGQYTNSARTVTSVTAYALPAAAFRRQLSKDTELDLHLIAKLCHDLRETQRHVVLLAQKRAVSKLAMFLRLQERLQSSPGRPAEIYLPMDRSDIADYVGMSLAAVSRGFRDLEVRGVITHRDRRHVKIRDRQVFAKLAGELVQPAIDSAD
jgi:CRP/FNR family transcriptional regulator